MTDKNSAIKFLMAGDLEATDALIQKVGMNLEESHIDPIVKSLEEKARLKNSRGDIRWANRLNRRRLALEDFIAGGLAPERIPKVTIPEGYCGKILMVSLAGGLADGTLCIRSGDEWHREILKTTKEEIEDLGFTASVVSPLGGASIRFKDRGIIEIHGSSDDFGMCDKKLAATMIKDAFPGKDVMIRS
jgi:hypothetical protein